MSKRNDWTMASFVRSPYFETERDKRDARDREKQKAKREARRAELQKAFKQPTKH